MFCDDQPVAVNYFSSPEFRHQHATVHLVSIGVLGDVVRFDLMIDKFECVARTEITFRANGCDSMIRVFQMAQKFLCV